MIWHSPALKEFLLEVGSEVKLEALGGVDQLRALVRESVEPIARLRAASAELGWGLDFDSLDIRKKADKDQLRIPLQSLCDALTAGETSASRADIYQAAEEFPLRTCPSTGEPLIHGKDAVAVTGVALRGLIGNLSHQAADPSELQKALRLTARAAHLEATAWFRALRSAIDERPDDPLR